MADDYEKAVERERSYEQEVMFFLGQEKLDITSLHQTTPAVTAAKKEQTIETETQIQAHRTSIQKVTTVVEKSATVISSHTGTPTETTSISFGRDVTHNSTSNEIKTDITAQSATHISQKMSQKEEVVTQMDSSKTVHSSISLSHEQTSTSSTSVVEVGHCQLDKSVMWEDFHNTERAFAEMFLTPEIMQLSENAVVVHDTVVPHAVEYQPEERKQGKDLDRLIRFMEQIDALREDNRQLQRRCDFLEDTKALLSLQNEALLTKPKSWGFLGKHHTPSPSHPALVKTTLLTPDINKQRFERMHSDCSETPSLLESLKGEDGQKLGLKRSQSDGSIELVDIDLGGPGGNRSRSADKSPTSKEPGPLSYKKSTKKLQQKLEKVQLKMKKVFTGKTETSHRAEGTHGAHGVVTAEQLVQANRVGRSGPRPSVLPHVPSDDGTALLLTTLSPEDRCQSRSIPTLAEPHTPSSVQSEPPGTLGQELETSSSESGAGRAGSAGPQTQLLGPALPPGDSSISSSSIQSDPLTEVHQTFLEASPAPIRRRKSSPTLSSLGLDDAHLLGLPMATSSPRIGRSSSFKVLKTENVEMLVGGSRSSPTSPVYEYRQGALRAASNDAAKKARQAWGKVKDMIQTRKDSLTRKNSGKKSGSTGEDWSDPGGYELSDSSPTEPLSPVEPLVYFGSSSEGADLEGRHDTELGSQLAKSQSLKAPSPCTARRQRSPSAPRVKGTSPRRSMSPPQAAAQKRKSLAHVMLSGSPAEMSALIPGMNDEFSRKMQEWEDKKKKGMIKANSFSCEPGLLGITDAKMAFSEDFIKKMEEWEQMKGLSPPGTLPTPPIEELLPSPGPFTPPPPVAPVVAGPAPLSKSFSRTVAEWERVKERRSREGGSQSPDRGRARSSPRDRARQREKSREKTQPRDKPRDKSRSKYHKELQKIEKKEQQIEREKQKLERLKLKLDMQYESSSGSSDGRPVGGGGGDGLSEDFRVKLQEWEGMKGFGSPQMIEVSPPVTEGRHSRSRSIVGHTHNTHTRTSPYRERVFSEGAILALVPPSITPDRSSTTPDSADSMAGLQQPADGQPPAPQMTDDSTSIDLNLTDESVASLEKTISRLRLELLQKNEDMVLMQDEVAQLTDRINETNIQHSDQIERYKRELWATSRIGRYTIEADLVAASIADLRLQLQQLQGHCRQLAADKDKLETEKDEAPGGDSRDLQILEAEVQRLERASCDVTVLRNLLEFLRSAERQVRVLQNGIRARNKMLEGIGRHLVIQDVTNKLLLAEVQRRELQLRFFKDRTKRGSLRRSKTFTGLDAAAREEQVGDEVVGFHRSASTGQRPVRPTPREAPLRVVGRGGARTLQGQVRALLGQEDAPSLCHDLAEVLRADITKAIDERSVEVEDEEPKPDTEDKNSQTVMTMLHTQPITSSRSTPAISSPTRSPATSPTNTPAPSLTGTPAPSPTSPSPTSPTYSPATSPTSTSATSPISTSATSPTCSHTAAPKSIPATSPTSISATSPTGTPATSPTSISATSPISISATSPISTPTAAPTSTPATSPRGPPPASPTSTPATSPRGPPPASPTSTPATSPRGSPPALPTSTPATSPTSKVLPAAASRFPVLTTASPPQLDAAHVSTSSCEVTSQSSLPTAASSPAKSSIAAITSAFSKAATEPVAVENKSPGISSPEREKKTCFLDNPISVKRIVRKQYEVDIDELYSPHSSPRGATSKKLLPPGEESKSDRDTSPASKKTKVLPQTSDKTASQPVLQEVKPKVSKEIIPHTTNVPTQHPIIAKTISMQKSPKESTIEISKKTTATSSISHSPAITKTTLHHVSETVKKQSVSATTHQPESTETISIITISSITQESNKPHITPSASIETKKPVDKNRSASKKITTRSLTATSSTQMESTTKVTQASQQFPSLPATQCPAVHTSSPASVAQIHLPPITSSPACCPAGNLPLDRPPIQSRGIVAGSCAQSHLLLSTTQTPRVMASLAGLSPKKPPAANPRPPASPRTRSRGDESGDIHRSRAVTARSDSVPLTCETVSDSQVHRHLVASSSSKLYSYSDWLRHDPNLPMFGAGVAHVDPDEGEDKEEPPRAAPPHSPIIRSKYPRKQRGGVSAQQGPPTESRIWNATPPRRLLRHRRPPGGERGAGSTGAGGTEPDPLSEEDENSGAVQRQRTKSDTSILSHIAKTKPTVASSMSRPVSKHYLEVQSSADLGSEVECDDTHNYFVRNGAFRKSPSPAVHKVSLARTRLKSAAELLQDSVERRTGSRPASPDSADETAGDTTPTTRTDKENSDQWEHIAAIKTTEVHSLPASMNYCLATSSPFQDITNGKERCAGGGLLSEPASSRHSSVDSSSLSGLLRPESCRSSLSLGESNATIDSVSLNTLSRSTGAIARQPITESSDSECCGQKDSSPKTGAKSGRRNLFSRRPQSKSAKRTVSGGAVSALCMQAVTVRVDKEGQRVEEGAAAAPQRDGGDSASPSPSPVASPDREKKRNKTKFPGGSWLQKKIFKVSKC